MKRLIAIIVMISFVLSNFQPVWAQSAEGFSINQLPVPGTMVVPSQNFVPVLLKGLVIHPNQPFNFDFIVDSGNDSTDKANIQEQSQRMIRYFLTALTIPAGDLWVNLSPYEKDRIITNELGQTDMGRDMLAQDYVLKQLTASLIYPEKDLGKEFWSRVYKKVAAQTGDTNVPVNTFNKVWIVPNGADVFEHGSAVYVTKAKLKVMLEEDYLSLKKHNGISSISKSQEDKTHAIGNQVVREIILPEIEKEVNEGQNFALLRQVYYAAILAKWYRAEIQKTILAQVYVDKKKVAGIDLKDNTVKEQIYQRYIRAYKKGVFNFIKEDTNNLTGQIVPRKYFSGGEILNQAMIHVAKVGSGEVNKSMVGEAFNARFSVVPEGPSAAMVANDDFVVKFDKTPAFAGTLGAYIREKMIEAGYKEGDLEGMNYGITFKGGLSNGHSERDFSLERFDQIPLNAVIGITLGAKEKREVWQRKDKPREQSTITLPGQELQTGEELKSVLLSQIDALKDGHEDYISFRVEKNGEFVTSWGWSFEDLETSLDSLNQDLLRKNINKISSIKVRIYRRIIYVTVTSASSPAMSTLQAPNQKQNAAMRNSGDVYDDISRVVEEMRAVHKRAKDSLKFYKKESAKYPMQAIRYSGASSKYEYEDLKTKRDQLVKEYYRINPSGSLPHSLTNDPAMLQPFMEDQAKAPGGIDLNQININGAGQGVTLQFDAAQISAITRPDFDGFRIIVNSVTQIRNPLSLMGVHVLK